MKTPRIKLLLGAFVMLATLAPPPASAKLIWQDFSLSLLSGQNYNKQKVAGGQTQDDSRTVVTFEHASGHTWGGTFLFIDRLMSRDSDYPNDALYGEFSINPTMFKPGGFVKSVYAASQWEFGSGDNGKDEKGGVNFNPSDGNSFNNYLLGVGMNLAVPKASFFNVTFYRRFNDDSTLDACLPTVIDPVKTAAAGHFVPKCSLGRSREDNEQITFVWRFDLAGGKVRFDGFLDAVTSFDINHKGSDEKTKAVSGFNFTPQLKYDIGSVMGMEPKKLWGGAEYVYWENKFGNKSWDERNLNLLLKWHF